MLYYRATPTAAAACTQSCAAAGDKTRFVHHYGSTVRNLHLGAIGDRFEETQKGDFVRRKTRIGRRVGADLGDVHGFAGQGCENETVGEILLGC